MTVTDREIRGLLEEEDDPGVICSRGCPGVCEHVAHLVAALKRWEGQR